MAAAMCDQRPERVPGARPARLPTVDTSWQGNPPQSTSTGSTWCQSMVLMSPRFGASGQWWAKTRATCWLFSENQIVSASKTCSTGEVEPAVPGEERADSEWTVVLGGVVHRGSAVLALPGQAMPASSYHLAGLNTCQVHDHRPVVRRQFSPSPRREVPSQATPFFSPPT